MRLPSSELTNAELLGWAREAGLEVSEEELARLRRQLGTMRDRLRAGTPRQRTAELSTYLAEARALAAGRPRHAPGKPRAAASRPVRDPGAPRAPRIAFASGGPSWAERVEGVQWRSLVNPALGLAGIMLLSSIVAETASRNRLDPMPGAVLVAMTPGGVPIPGFGLLAGGALAALWCHGVRRRSSRAWAVLACLVVLAAAYASFTAMIAATGCVAPGSVSIVPAIAVWTGALVGISAAEREHRTRALVALSGMLAAVPYGYLSMPIVMFGCSR